MDFEEPNWQRSIGGSWETEAVDCRLQPDCACHMDAIESSGHIGPGGTDQPTSVKLMGFH
jgi:hypothetical protein